MAASSNCAEKRHANLWLLCGLLALAQIFCSPVRAANNQMDSNAISIEVDQAKDIPLLFPAATVFIANPDIADVQVPAGSNGKSVLLYAKKPGTTTFYARDRRGQTTDFTVNVLRPVSEIEADITREVAGAHIHVSSAPNGLIVSGSAPSPAAAAKLRSLAQQYLGDKDSLTFNVAVEGETQVNLQVRVAQVSRTVDKEFGFNWNAIFNNNRIAIGLLTGRTPATSFGSFVSSPNNLDSLGFGYRSRGGSVNISALIDALQTEGLVTVLAEPNLTAISGETANFLAGGEFPVPVPQGLQQITIEWKRFGVSVDFTPTVLDGDRISIKVRPEVSELSSAGAVTIQGIQVPALTVRRADTTVELASGESFAIAGLFQNNVTTDVQRYPWLGDIPILGALFRSSSFQRQESELVIIVTPYLVKPVEHAADARLPTDGLTFATDLERVLWGHLTHQGAAAPPGAGGAPHLHGPAGFLWE